MHHRTRPRRSHVALMLCLVAVGLSAVAPAEGRVRVGIGEQNASMFASTHWKKLHARDVRYLVPWNTTRDLGLAVRAHDFMTRAHAARQRVLVAFTAAPGCWNGKRYSKARHCKAPSTRAYRKAITAFMKRYPWVHTYSTWNEANHGGQPTYRKPALAARYYRVIRRVCRSRHCRVIALDLIGGPTMAPYVRRFKAHAKSARLWGLHNYGDVRRNRGKDTARLTRLVRGQVWITETGGILRFAGHYKPSLRRAAAYTRRAFRIARRYAKRRHHMRSRVAAVYIYQWFGAPKRVRWDSGLVSAKGSPRPALRVLSKELRRARRR